jgi:hypothetical protein
VRRRAPLEPLFVLTRLARASPCTTHPDVWKLARVDGVLSYRRATTHTLLYPSSLNAALLSSMPCALDDDVLELVAQYCSMDDLRQMRVVSRRLCTLFTPHAFRRLDIWFTHSWIDAIHMRLGQLTDRYAYLETYIQQVVVHFTECNYREYLTAVRYTELTDGIECRLGVQHCFDPHAPAPASSRSRSLCYS